MARSPSQLSDERRDGGTAEDDGLLTGQHTGKHSTPAPPSRWARWREVGLFAWALIATAAVVILAVVVQHAQGPSRDVDLGRGGSEDHDAGIDGYTPPAGKRNLIFMVSDGMGPTALTLTRSWRQHTQNQHWDAELFLDDYLIGQSRTRSTSSLITDSAAGATAFSCGLKSYNGAISVLPNMQPCGSVMEAAKRMGYTTGLVVTTRLTDATPAVFASHVRKRDLEDEIALQMIGETHPLGRMVDVMMGGGRCTFLPQSDDDGCRADDTDVTAIAQTNGWTYLSSRAEFDNLTSTVSLPLLALLAHEDIPYEIDRRHVDDEYPSLAEMTRTALDILAAATADTDEGFFVMIEGSRIDHAGHANDAAAEVHEVLAYDAAMTAVLDFIAAHEEATGVPTLMVSTSDHETGGLATARQLTNAYPEYHWFPGVLANASQSAAFTAHAYHDYLRALPDDAAEFGSIESFLHDLLPSALGIHDPSAAEVDALILEPGLAAYTFADMVSRRAQAGWTTHGHSGADVNIYASSPRLAAPLRGNHENTDVGAFLRRFLAAESEVDKVTAELRAYADAHADAWLGSIPVDEERLDGQDHLEHYEGHSGARHKRSGGCTFCGH